jgi:hypothetical protein
MMEVTVLHVKNAMCGNIASVSVSHRKRPKRTTSILSAGIASKKRKTPTSPNFLPSNLGSALRYLLVMLLRLGRSAS